MGRRARGGAGARAGNKVVPADSPRGPVRASHLRGKVKSRSLWDPRWGPNRRPNRASLKRTRAALWIRAASVCFLFYAQNKQTEQTPPLVEQQRAEQSRASGAERGHYRGSRELWTDCTWRSAAGRDTECKCAGLISSLSL